MKREDEKKLNKKRKKCVMKTLKALRKMQHGDTQTHLANKIGVNQQTIARWEKGATEPSIKKIKALATQCKVVTTDILLEHEPSACFSWATLSHIWMEQLMVKKPDYKRRHVCKRHCTKAGTVMTVGGIMGLWC